MSFKRGSETKEPEDNTVRAVDFTMKMPDYYKSKRDIPRFDSTMNDKESAMIFFRNWSIMGLHKGLILKPAENMNSFDWGLQVLFEYNNASYLSLYIYLDEREDAQQMQAVHQFIQLHRTDNWIVFKNAGLSIETVRKQTNGAQCQIIDGTNTFHIAKSYKEYEYVQRYYGDKVTDRTGIHMINHIDEGLFILNEINASMDAKRAYIIHPLVQSDIDLKSFYNHSNGVDLVDKHIVVLAMEYRNIANAHLSFHQSGLNTFKLSPLKEVNDMLIADKIQNRKDFELFHDAKQPRSQKLQRYFKEWLQKLHVSEREFTKIIYRLLKNCGGNDLHKISYIPKGSMSQIDLTKFPGYEKAVVRNQKKLELRRTPPPKIEHEHHEKVVSDNSWKWTGLIVGMFAGFVAGYGCHMLVANKKAD